MDPEQDPGLARDRTRLAWRRTAIAFAAIGGVLLRRDAAAGLPVLALTPVIWVLGSFRGWPRPLPRAGRLLLVTVIVVLVSVVAVSVAVFVPAPVSRQDVIRGR